VRKEVQVWYCRGMPKVFSNLQYRRDRAVIAFKENVLIGPLIDAVDAAVGSATRVRITDNMLDEAYEIIDKQQLSDPDRIKWETMQEIFKAAFKAAGFEVVD
jgi:hypothetical protein